MQYDHKVMMRYLLIGGSGKVRIAIKENTIVRNTRNNSKIKDRTRQNTITQT